MPKTLKILHSAAYIVSAAALTAAQQTAPIASKCVLKNSCERHTDGGFSAIGAVP